MNPPETLADLLETVPDFNFRNYIEFMALISGRKDVVRLSIHDESEAPLRAGLARLGLACVRSRFRQETSFASALGDSYTSPVPFDQEDRLPYTVMAARDHATAAAAMAVEDDPTAIGGLGELLGYPDCCAASYEEISEHCDWLAVWLRNTPLQPSYDYRGNKLAYLFWGRTLFFDYFPCSAMCAQTRTISVRTEDELRAHGLVAVLEAVRAEMCVPIMIIRGVVVALQKHCFRPDASVLEYDLSHSRRWLWEAHADAPDHCFWSSNNLTLGCGNLECRDGDRVLGYIEQDVHQRLMVFR